jgi:hypothetical protein
MVMLADAVRELIDELGSRESREGDIGKIGCAEDRVRPRIGGQEKF